MRVKDVLPPYVYQVAREAASRAWYEFQQEHGPATVDRLLSDALNAQTMAFWSIADAYLAFAPETPCSRAFLDHIKSRLPWMGDDGDPERLATWRELSGVHARFV